jgi:hypothetical protein
VNTKQIYHVQWMEENKNDASNKAELVKSSTDISRIYFMPNIRIRNSGRPTN